MWCHQNDDSEATSPVPSKSKGKFVRTATVEFFSVRSAIQLTVGTKEFQRYPSEIPLMTNAKEP